MKKSREVTKMTPEELEAWNSRYPPGSPCIVHRAISEATITTQTSSVAWLAGGGYPLVKLKGVVGGGYSLSFIDMLPPTPPQVEVTR